MSSEEAGLRSRIAELEAALARATQDSTLLRSILEHTTDFIFVKDAEHRWIRASRSFEPILNRHRDQILGAKYAAFKP